MNEDIRTAAGERPLADVSQTRRLVPMQVGSATVYVEQFSEPAEIEADDRIYAVAPSPAEAFETASEVLRECVRVVGDRIKQLAEESTPQQVTVEFSLTFEVSGKASFIPIFVTGETRAQTGLKVTAVWQRAGAKDG